jgi:hypothetical protein
MNCLPLSSAFRSAKICTIKQQWQRLTSLNLDLRATLYGPFAFTTIPSVLHQNLYRHISCSSRNKVHIIMVQNENRWRCNRQWAHRNTFRPQHLLSTIHYKISYSWHIFVALPNDHPLCGLSTEQNSMFAHPAQPIVFISLLTAQKPYAGCIIQVLYLHYTFT